MIFHLAPSITSASVPVGPAAILVKDGWDDWFEFETMYILYYLDEEGAKHRVGEVKIGQFGMEKGQRSPNLPSAFESLDEQLFSLGQGSAYYDELNELGHDVREQILRSMNDVAYEPELFERALFERVTGVSLLRSVPRASVRGQLARMARGGARVTRFKFSYKMPQMDGGDVSPTIDFNVMPDSQPPTNLHVLIGRNGVGKTFTLNGMTKALLEGPSASTGTFAIKDDPLSLEEVADEFSTLVSVTFSAFDPFDPLPLKRDQSEGIQYHYVGLKQQTKNKDGSQRAPKDHKRLAQDFATSLKIIMSIESTRLRWVKAVQILESDPLFKRAEVWSLADMHTDSLDDYENDEGFDKHFRDRAVFIFDKFSSGHKIVLLTITRLVETVTERALVLMDEPEAHLHPPLLSAFVRSVSDLMIDRNAVAIIATHSPVILQEVPKNCVWKIRRSGLSLAAERPKIQTFGENVGLLTHEVFGLEVTESGFYLRLAEVAARLDSFEDVIEHFSDQIGSEGRALVRAILSGKQT